jgi:parallel beta-helix repeat protein
VLPGEYTITAALTMTKADVTLCAAHPTVPHVQPSTSIVCATNSVGMLTVDAANCTVEGLRFDHNAGTAAINIIDVGATTASPGTTLRNLFIDMEGSATDTDGIELSNAVNSLIEGCTIHDYDQDGIIVDAGCDETVIRNCVIRDGVTANAGQYGISTVSDNSIIEDCTVQTDGTAGIYCNVGLLVHINRCYVFCTGANTLGIAAANTGTMSVKNCHITAMAAGNVVDFATSATVPSAVIAWEGIDGTNPTIGVLTTATVDGL